MSTAIVQHSLTNSGDDPPPAGVHPLLWRIYRLRGIRSADELDLRLAALLPPRRLSGIDKAVDVLAAALDNKQRILIIGDFDADGATSCALAVLVLRAFGHAAVDFLVPNRFEFGYGLTPEIVEVARTREPDVIVTVDNGISSLAGVAAARRLGWQVVITDHHLAGAELPDAHALVNPNLPGDSFPSKALAGVGVIYYVLLELRARLRETGWFERQRLPVPNMADYLDLVALGTVADVVPLDRNNRILVHQGLQRIRAGRCRAGIRALLQIAGRNPARAQASDLGFAVGPRLNAAGRLDDMALGIRCLVTEDPDQASELAGTLDRFNRERRTIEDGMRQQAEAMLATCEPQAADELPWGLCLYRKDWHQGVIGILASRIKDRHHRPVIAFAAAGDGLLKGSARSIPGLHIRDALDEVAVRAPDVLQRFGGHAMAAGMTLAESDLTVFSGVFDQVVRSRLQAQDLQPVIRSDGPIAPSELSLETARAILAGGPWGQAFPEPLFDDRFQVLSSRVVGERHWKLVLQPFGTELGLDAIAFNAVERLPVMPAAVHAAYRLDQNEWQGRLSLQLRIEHLEPAPES